MKLSSAFRSAAKIAACAVAVCAVVNVLAPADAARSSHLRHTAVRHKVVRHAVKPVVLYKDASAPVEARVKDLLSRMTLEEKVAQMLAVWN
ncbi:MAG: hypothetical protein KGM97_05865, partial [Alphaproteobacteria bacterium]|nr:hypothetical protein [Alphaproteobacteria bacterium]